jgi:hypothetical protein
MDNDKNNNEADQTKEKLQTPVVVMAKDNKNDHPPEEQQPSDETQAEYREIPENERT